MAAVDPKGFAGSPATLAFEAVPIVIDTFSNVFALLGDVMPGDTTRSTEAQEYHGDGAVSYLVNPQIAHAPMTLTCASIDSDATQDELTGLQAHFKIRDFFQMQFRGPNWVAGVADEVQKTVTVTGISLVSPVGAGAFKITFTIQATGSYTVNGVTFGGPIS